MTERIVNYEFQNLSDRKLKTNVEPATFEELQEVFDAVMPQWYQRTEGNQKRTLGFIAQHVQGAAWADRGRRVGGPGDARLLQAGLRPVGRLQGVAGVRGGPGEEGQEAGPLVIENGRGEREPIPAAGRRLLGPRRAEAAPAGTAGNPGPAGHDLCPGRAGFAGRRGQADFGPQAPVFRQECGRGPS